MYVAPCSVSFRISCFKTPHTPRLNHDETDDSNSDRTLMSLIYDVFDQRHFRELLYFQHRINRGSLSMQTYRGLKVARCGVMADVVVVGLV